MGMPIPLGLRLLTSQRPELIPWAWGVNGAMSVTASVTALAVAPASGFNQALLVGVAAYLAAILALRRAGDAPTPADAAPAARS